ncbi:MAG: dynamin family protein [Boseongicola sp.]
MTKNESSEKSGVQTAEGEPEFDVIDASTEEMVEEPAAMESVDQNDQKKPVLCLMGEFSAGKSTLSNLLIKTSALPVNVTATQLPPVWISKGDDKPYRVALDGQEFDIDLESLEDVSVEDTKYIRIFHDADLLDNCDLIDMPGISDPNMDADVWQRVIHRADAVIWCTHATQAWRQSEAAVWAMLPPELYENSFLLLTRMDKILSERDKLRVAKRVGRETDGLFKELFPISLTHALSAGNDREKWTASGAEAFTDALTELLSELSGGGASADEAASVEDEMPERTVMPARVRPKPLKARSLRSRPRSERPIEPLPPL